MARMRGEGKLGAYLTKDGKAWQTTGDETVLYLGAAEGVTARWMAQRLPDGQVLAVEKSPVASLSLLRAARELDNLIPVVADARDPGAFDPMVGEVDLLYQDLAQRDQVDIFLKNARAFEPKRGFLAVKARSIAVERSPKDVFEEAAAQVQGPGDIIDIVRLDPHHKDHAMIVCDFPKTRTR